MKQKRETFSGAVHRTHEDQSSFTFVKPKARRPDQFCADEAEAIRSQLQNSLKDRRARLSRVAKQRTASLELVRCVVMSPSDISHRTETTADASTASISTRWSESTHSRGRGEVAYLASYPKAPTLDDINEAFEEDPSAISNESSDDSGAMIKKNDVPSLFTVSDNSSTYGSDIEADEPVIREEPHKPQNLTIRTLRSFEEQRADIHRVRQARSFESISRKEGKGDIKLMTMDDLDIPGSVCSSISKHGSMSSLMQRSASYSSLSTAEDRAAYMEGLYESPLRSASMRRDTGLPRHEREELNRQMMEELAEMSSQPALLDLSLVKDHDKRRAFLQKMQNSVGDIASPIMGSPFVSRGRMDTASLIISDASSYSGTDASNTSGWVSNTDHETLELSMSLHESITDEASLLSSIMLPFSERSLTSETDQVWDDEELLLPTPPHLRKKPLPPSSALADFVSKPPPHLLNTTVETEPLTLSVGESEDETTIGNCSDIPTERILFVPESVADEMCEEHGGLYHLALESGMSTKTPIRLMVVPVKQAVDCLRLSSDFRCGAYGSMYDIATRSGMMLETKELPKTRRKKKREVRAQGGWLDLALRSGLDDLHSHEPLELTCRTHSLRGDEISVLPESRTDSSCGANGSLFLAGLCS